MLTAEQLKMRMSGIGASESPCIVGCSPFGNKISVWASKMGLEIVEETPEMEIGNALEDGIGRLYMKRTGRWCANWGTVRHPTAPWMVCTPDLCVFGERRIAQIKLVGQWMAHHWEDRESVPDYVEVQVQHEMEVTGADVCDVVALIGGTDLRIIPVARDREMGAALVDVCGAFWRDHVETREMPEVDGSEEATRLLRATLLQRDEAVRIATPEVEESGRRWLSLDAEIAELSKEQARHEQIMKQFIGDARGIEAEAFRVTWATSKAGRRTFLLKPSKNQIAA